MGEIVEDWIFKGLDFWKKWFILDDKKKKLKEIAYNEDKGII